MSTSLDARRPGRRARSVALASIMGAALACAAGCESMLSPTRYGEIRVTVATNAGLPVSGVSVNLYTGFRPIEYAFTDLNGVYVFERVVTGTLYGVTAGIPRGLGDLTQGPYLVQDNLEVEPGTRREVVFTLVPCTGTVVVAVRDDAGRPAPGIAAILYDAVGTLGTQNTAADGTTRFVDVACGELGVRLEENPSYVITPGYGTSYRDGLQITPTATLVSIAFTVRAAARTGAVSAMRRSAGGITAPVNQR
jgi:hypothetical protein